MGGDYYVSSTNKTLISSMSLIYFCILTLLIQQQPETCHALTSPLTSDILKLHNDARGKVGVGPLTWDGSLATYAQTYANRRVGDCRKFEVSNGPYGENTFWGWGKVYSEADAFWSWLEGRKYYDYSSNSCQKGKLCLQYTQVVWKSTAKVGCGRVKCKNGDYFIVCSYSPTGNVFGQKPY